MYGYSTPPLQAGFAPWNTARNSLGENVGAGRFLRSRFRAGYVKSAPWMNRDHTERRMLTICTGRGGYSAK
jgi:hypothetical protein